MLYDKLYLTLTSEIVWKISRRALKGQIFHIWQISGTMLVGLSAGVCCITATGELASNREVKTTIHPSLDMLQVFFAPPMLSPDPRQTHPVRYGGFGARLWVQTIASNQH